MRNPSVKYNLKKITTKYGVSEYRLSNGLRVLYKRVIGAPVVALCVTFHVGSRNEAKGHTGSTHILEHLLFKDSKNFNRKNGKSISGYLDSMGAYVNATTWLDRTNYFELLPRECLGEALQMEADRMRNSLFTDADLASEMTAVRNEYEISRNNPFELLDEEVVASAYRVHPYRIPTIGTKEDIENSTAANLRKFYDVFYWPNNATLSVFGNISFAEVKKMTIKYFGAIPSSPHLIPTMNTVEPPQEKPRSISIQKPLGLSIVELAYKIPQGTHPDFPALVALGTILGGGFASRLQKALVDKGLAANISLAAPALHDPGLITFTAHAADGVAPERLRAAMRKELRSIANRAPLSGELTRAKERILSEFAYERDGVFAEIRAVSEWTAAGDWALGYRLEEKMRKLKPTDILRVAKKYLQPACETSGTLIDKAVTK